MPKLSSKIALTSGAIAIFALGAYNLTVTPKGSNSSVVTNDNRDSVNLVSVWDKETEPNYLGTKAMTVYRSPSCGCCGMWIEHAKKHGFIVQDIKTEGIEAIKQKYQIPTELASCHTTIIDDYVMEGHIPADDLKRFLAKKPNMTGLTVPGMPIGTPGMEARDIKQPFQVLAFNDQGKVEVFKEYSAY